VKCCTVKIGELRSLVSLQRRVSTPDVYGGFVTTWTEYARVWAKIEPKRGIERLHSMQLENPITHDVFIRYRADVLESDRIVHLSRNFNVRSVRIVDEKRRFLQIDAEENVAP
jgi:SPP1 family predicted phage head-tail adaptor